MAVDTVSVDSTVVCLEPKLRAPLRTYIYDHKPIMDEFLGKKYKLKSSENFEEYLKFIGVGLVSRKLATTVSPVCVLTKNDDGSYNLAMTTTVRNMILTFTLGEEFSEERPDGTKVQSLMIWKGTELIQTQTKKSGRKSTHIRKFSPTTLTVTTTADGWNGTCVRVYELID
ncbi:fatty acid-binding protein, muscle-like [Aricia agestis]|uniref:fatty acid-binding protein, muscle-like n=1 Tax=Aricia agestis TaxID=91739 RepID=UPI001C2063D6|nr:fatty acid-binding protein, muscle-like [Aricia agestis]